jgi:glyoxylase-like metal-dependent hydrolase (beta-lactamase superfamily II)
VNDGVGGEKHAVGRNVHEEVGRGMPRCRDDVDGDAGYLPNLSAGGPAEWRQWLGALATVRRLAPLVVVPGHGPVLEGSAIEAGVARVERILRKALG